MTLTGIILLTVVAFHLTKMKLASASSDRTSSPVDTTNPARDYLALRDRMIKEFSLMPPGRFGAFLPGVVKKVATQDKGIALTFDACGGKGRGYNAKLISLLRQTKTPATLFVTGLWINENPAIFRELAKDPLFEIENHGLHHRVCGVRGEEKFGVMGTNNVGEVVDEMELNARKIAAITGRRPTYIRSATTYADEAAVKIAQRLGMEMVSYSVLPGDADPSVTADVQRDNILNGARRGAVVLMHVNHPGRHEEDALREAIPNLKAQGYTFVKLSDAR
jgi:peptidoglycan/xylan/chitin deacetylase (PgdA/CDA1 family)